MRFPKSTRVERLRAARLESEGSFAKASEAYDAILEANPADAVSRGSSRDPRCRPAGPSII